jgi:hypothetical protein
MSVNVNTVYQRVLAITNKEQRGYITPQEFNYMANQAQLDIFEQYFYDLNQFARLPGNSTEYSDMLDILEEKISLFEKVDATVTGGITLPSDVYRLGSILYNGIDAEHITQKDWLYIKKSPLSQPSNDFPIYLRDSETNAIKVYADSITANETAGVTCNYIKTPAEVKWGYDTTTGLYDSDSAKTTHFELHASEETELVVKILALAGIVLKDPGLYQIGSAEEVKNVQQEKA